MTVFLIANLDDELYVILDSDSYKLKKSLHRLNVSPLFRYKKLKIKLGKFGIKELESSECVFNHKNKKFEAVTLAYVDYLVILCDDADGKN